MTANVQSPRLICILAFDDAQLLDIAGPAQTFTTANDIAGGEARTDGPPYRVVVGSQNGGLIRTSCGLPVMTEPLAAQRKDRPIDTLIVAGGIGVGAAAVDRELVDWVARQSRTARRTASVCTGAFVLAATGLLAGRAATTHWKACARLAELHPEIKVERDPIYVQDGPFWTSAGVTAGIDLVLALVEQDLGRRLAMRVAQHLVVFLKRPGGQSQFSAPLAAQSAAAAADPEDRFAALHAWIAGHLADDLRVERLAQRAGMSERTFARAYAAKLGTTPAKAVEALRLEAARRALEDTAMPIKQIAGTCGFGDEERMRRAFIRQLAVSPLDYRKRFSTAAMRDEAAE